MFNWLRRKPAVPASTPSAAEDAEDPLIPVPIPALVALLLNVEKTNGTPLTEPQVNALRDKCVCMMMRQSAARALAEKRGYDDIDPAHAWPQWQAIRESLHEA